MFENKIIRRAFWPGWEEAGECCIISLIYQVLLGWQTWMGGIRDAKRILVGKHEESDGMGGLGIGEKVILKWLRETGYQGVGRIHLAQERDHWWASIRGSEFCDKLNDYWGGHGLKTGQITIDDDDDNFASGECFFSSMVLGICDSVIWYIFKISSNLIIVSVFIKPAGDDNICSPYRNCLWNQINSNNNLVNFIIVVDCFTDMVTIS